jgi:hypothetical protein
LKRGVVSEGHCGAKGILGPDDQNGAMAGGDFSLNNVWTQRLFAGMVGSLLSIILLFWRMADI